MAETEIPPQLTRVWKAAHFAANPWKHRRTWILFGLGIALGATMFVLFANLNVDEGFAVVLGPLVLAIGLLGLALQLARAQELIRHLTDPPQDD